MKIKALLAFALYDVETQTVCRNPSLCKSSKISLRLYPAASKYVDGSQLEHGLWSIAWISQVDLPRNTCWNLASVKASAARKLVGLAFERFQVLPFAPRRQEAGLIAGDNRGGTTSYLTWWGSRQRVGSMGLSTDEPGLGVAHAAKCARNCSSNCLKSTAITSGCADLCISQKMVEKELKMSVGQTICHYIPVASDSSIFH